MKKFKYVKGRIREHFKLKSNKELKEIFTNFVVMGGYDDENGNVEFEEIIGVKSNLCEAVGIGFDYISSCVTDFIEDDDLKKDFEFKISPIAEMDETSGYIISFSLAKNKPITHWVKIYIDDTNN